jgi:hypothetical protein
MREEYNIMIFSTDVTEISDQCTCHVCTERRYHRQLD